MSHYDLFVIGGGSGGVRCARMAAAAGMRVAIAEDTHWGGTCVNVGCVPKKMMVYAAHYASDFADSEDFGWSYGETSFDWSLFRQRKDQEISRLNGIYKKLLGNVEVDLIEGFASIVEPGVVSVGEDVFQADKILLAVGGTPVVPEIPGADLCITSDEVFFLDEMPKRIAVIGGGYIATEFASIFNGLGADTHLLYRGDLLLRGFDEELRKGVGEAISDAGVNVNLGVSPVSITEKSSSMQLTLSSGDVIDVDQVMMATGRKPRVAGLLANDSLSLNLTASGLVSVDKNMQTSIPGVYALGDAVGRMALTPVATAEAMALLAHWQTGQDFTFDYTNIPTAIFTLPNASTVGITEQEALATGKAHDVYTSSFRHLKHTLGDNQERVFMKLIVEVDSQKVVGAHMIGPDAGEVIQGIAVAIKAGATKADFDGTIGIHPSMAEEFVTMRAATRTINA